MQFRTIVVYKKEEKIIFLYGFSKNEKSHIDKVELQYFKKLGSDLLVLKSRQVTDSIEKQILFDLEVVGVGWAKRFLTFLLGTPQVGILSQHVELTAK